ncbi:unnamed protein product [Pieris macdunnoughi]|uniref:Uncharacterized protein n=1 Tax=Pieris macdunnoughi TaxID=345717 RepID=A0A821UAZ1_9NEOP|nr:unnamed protein product [Pieris macdunnoughi]
MIWANPIGYTPPPLNRNGDSVIVMIINRAGLGEFCVVEWIQGSKAGRRDTVSRDLVELQPDRGPSACKVRSPFSNQYSPAVLHFHNDDIKCISMFKLLSTNTAAKNAVVPSDKASRKRQGQRSPPAVQRVGKGHTDLGRGGPRDSTDELRYIVVEAYDSLPQQYACVPRSWIKASTGTSLAAGASCMEAWPAQMSGAKADMEELGSRARLGHSPSPKWGLRRFNCVHATANYDAGQDWIRTMTKGQPIYSGDPRPAKVPRISDSSRRFTSLQLTNTPRPSISAVVNELHEMSVCHDTDDCSSFLPAQYNTEEFRKLITTYHRIPKRQRPANSVPDHTAAPTPVLDSLANLPYLEPLRSTSIRENSSSAARKSRKTTSFSTSAKVMFSIIAHQHRLSRHFLHHLIAHQHRLSRHLRRLHAYPLPPSNHAPATSIPSFASTSVPTPLPPSNRAPATSIPSFASTSVPTPLPPSNHAPATSIPSFASTSVPTPLPPSNRAPATSIPSFASTSVPTPLPPSNHAPATSIPSFASTSVPTTIQSTAASVPCSELLSFTSAISLQYVSPATSTPLLPLIPSTSVVTPSQASTSVDHTSTTVSSSIARTTLPKAQSPSTTTRAEPNSSQIITKRQIRCEFIKLISKITELDEDLEKMCNSTVKGIHSSALKFQESMKPFYNYCLSKNNDVAVEAN